MNLINTQQAELYQRIQAFSLDATDASLPFSKRLARDNGWTIEYARRVINEYKKFMFLAVVADHPVTPSDQVDQAWHLHLLYTRSYWQEFCPNILQTSIHHGPTQGGIKERRKFDNWYNKTLASYERFFQQSPPVDIWPPSHIRFGRDVRFVRVNTQDNWIFPKATLNFLSEFRIKKSAIFVLSFFLALSITGCTISNLIVNIPLVIWCIVAFIAFIIWSSTRSDRSSYTGSNYRSRGGGYNVGGGGDSGDDGDDGDSGDGDCDGGDGGCGGCGGCGD